MRSQARRLASGRRSSCWLRDGRVDAVDVEALGFEFTTARPERIFVHPRAEEQISGAGVGQGVGRDDGPAEECLPVQRSVIVGECADVDRGSVEGRGQVSRVGTAAEDDDATADEAT